MFKQNSYYLTDHGDVVDYFSLDEYIHKYKEFLTEANAELLDWELNADKERLEITYEVERDGELEKDFEYVNYQVVTAYTTAV